MQKRALPLLLAALLVLPACSRSHTISTAEGKVTYSQKGKDAGTMTFAGKNGETVTTDVNSGRIPGDYPSDVPVYKNARVTLSQTVSGKNARILTMQATDKGAAIAAFYKAGLESNGWKIESTANVGEMSLMTAAKDTRQFTVQITNSDDRRLIHQILADNR